jgi:hypothetical protein
MATPGFAQFLQFLWASIQGGGGVIDMTIQGLFASSPTPDAEIGKLPIFDMPSGASQSEDRTWLLAERSFADLYRRIDNVELLAAAQLPAPVQPMRLWGYTVATLPAGVRGDMAYVTDGNAPAFLTAIAGGGAIVTPVFFNGTAWIAF